MPKWTSEDERRLISEWKKKSAAQLAEELNKSRSAVSGMATRLRIKGRLEGTDGKQYETPPRPPAKEKQTKASDVFHMKRPPPLQQLLQSDKVPELKNGHSVSFEELCDWHCRWPIDNADPQDIANFRFCGARKITGSSYCPHHARRAFTRSNYRREMA